MRPTWDEYFLEIARGVSTGATCTRRQIGVVITDKNNQIVSTGYNGAPSGYPQCDEIGCLMVDGHCKRSLHADENAILHMEKTVKMLHTMYIHGGTPCIDCARLILATKIKRVVCSERYWKDEGTNLLIENGVEVIIYEQFTITT